MCSLLSLTAIGAATVWACGPDFPLQLLDDRVATLKTMPPRSFHYQVTHLVPKDSTQAGVARGATRLSHTLQQRLESMAKAATGDAAFALGEGLPDAVRLYSAGAVDYREMRHGHGTSDGGEKRFQAILDLPEDRVVPRAAQATYMLGKLHAQRQFARGFDTLRERDAALHAFERVRAFVQRGDSDPDGLLASSYGEQARLFLNDGKSACDWTSFPKNSASAAAIAPADLQQAIRLYVRQVVNHDGKSDDEKGLDSLQLIMDWVFRDPQRIGPLLHDSLVCQVIVAYVLAQTDGLFVDGDRVHGADNPPSAKLKALARALHEPGVDLNTGADRLAMLAYNVGEYDSARVFADRAHTVLSGWVKAKLAVRAGDMPRAAAAYADAVKGFPALDADSGDASVDAAEAQRLKGEQGVLTLSRGEYVAAFAILYDVARIAGMDSGAHYDAAYVAERVLTTDELKSYIDAHIPPTPVPPASASPASASSSETAHEADIPLPTVADAMRFLLARRLVRDGRIAEAVAYFPEDQDPRYALDDDDGQNGTVRRPQPFRAWARAYGDALHRVDQAWTKGGRAKAWFEAATLARVYGMSIMGTEQGPDYAFSGGAYDTGSGPELHRISPNGVVTIPPTPEERARFALPGPFVQPGERARFQASEARPYKRFHYRWIAVQEAGRAADSVPPRSQAFAAILCTAASWGTDQDKALYRRYVREGAYVPFARRFGQHCPVPNFRAAAWFPYAQVWRKAWSVLHHHPMIPIGCVGLLVVAVAVFRRYGPMNGRSSRS